MAATLDIAAIYAQHAFAVRRRCFALVGNMAEAQELAQEVFMQLLEKPEAFAGRARISTYLFALATNMSLNRLRHHRLRHGDWQQSVQQNVVQGMPVDCPEGRVIDRELVALVLRAHDPETAAMVLYHYVDGLSQQEIADVVGLSRVTVNQRLARFVAAAQKTLGATA